MDGVLARGGESDRRLARAAGGMQVAKRVPDWMAMPPDALSIGWRRVAAIIPAVARVSWVSCGNARPLQNRAPWISISRPCSSTTSTVPSSPDTETVAIPEPPDPFSGFSVVW